MLAMGLLARYTEVLQLPSGWQWLSNGWVIAILTVLLAIEVVADKVPVVDHIKSKYGEAAIGSARVLETGRDPRRDAARISFTLQR